MSKNKSRKMKGEFYMENNNTEKQIKGLLYEEEKMNHVLNILNTIPVSGNNQIKSMGSVFDILLNPLPFTNIEDKDTK